MYQKGFISFKLPRSLKSLLAYNHEMNLSGLPLTLSYIVQSKHLDELGHMNVMWYTHFFDEATWNFYESIGFGQDYHQSGFSSFALEAHSVFISELREGDHFSIYTRVLARSDKVFHLMHFMQRDADQKLSATLEALGIHIDMSTRKSAAMPEAIATQWDAIIVEHSALDWDAPLSGSLHP